MLAAVDVRALQEALSLCISSWEPPFLWCYIIYIERKMTSIRWFRLKSDIPSILSYTAWLYMTQFRIHDIVLSWASETILTKPDGSFFFFQIRVIVQSTHDIDLRKEPDTSCLYSSGDEMSGKGERFSSSRWPGSELYSLETEIEDGSKTRSNTLQLKWKWNDILHCLQWIVNTLINNRPHVVSTPVWIGSFSLRPTQDMLVSSEDPRLVSGKNPVLLWHPVKKVNRSTKVSVRMWYHFLSWVSLYQSPTPTALEAWELQVNRVWRMLWRQKQRPELCNPRKVILYNKHWER